MFAVHIATMSANNEFVKGTAGKLRCFRPASGGELPRRVLLGSSLNKGRSPTPRYRRATSTRRGGRGARSILCRTSHPRGPCRRIPRPRGALRGLAEAREALRGLAEARSAYPLRYPCRYPLAKLRG